jgi:hypothetical protein
VQVLQITDGTSNTIMLAEDAGRPANYKANGQINPLPAPGSGGWADYNGPFSIAGPNPRPQHPGDLPDELLHQQRSLFLPHRWRQHRLL